MKSSTRKILKASLGIFDSSEGNSNCGSCMFHDKLKVCQIHGMKTSNMDVCKRIKKHTRKEFYRGGSVSPR
jgi:hypothetical protein